MEIGDGLRPYLARREPAYDRKRDRPLELVQRLVRRAGACHGTYAAVGQFERIAFAQAPSVALETITPKELPIRRMATFMQAL